jgi:hypothetical protein
MVYITYHLDIVTPTHISGYSGKDNSRRNADCRWREKHRNYYLLQVRRGDKQHDDRKGVTIMHVTGREFIESPALYLDKVETGSVQIIKDGRTIAILAKPSNTPISDSLVGLLKDSGISSAAMKVGI